MLPSGSVHRDAVAELPGSGSGSAASPAASRCEAARTPHAGAPPPQPDGVAAGLAPKPDRAPWTPPAPPVRVGTGAAGPVPSAPRQPRHARPARRATRRRRRWPRPALGAPRPRSSSAAPGSSSRGSSAAARSSNSSTMSCRRDCARATASAASAVRARSPIDRAAPTGRPHRRSGHELGCAVGARARPARRRPAPAAARRGRDVGQQVAHLGERRGRIALVRPPGPDQRLHLANRRRQRGDQRARHRQSRRLPRVGRRRRTRPPRARGCRAAPRDPRTSA